MAKNKKKKINYQRLIAIILLIGMLAAFISSCMMYF